MTGYRKTLPANSEWIEKCARHSSPYTARSLHHIYLCDRCAERLVNEGLNGRPFVYHGETVEGFCGLCNRLTSVTLRIHFACLPCWTVVNSYQKGFVASRAVHEMWEKFITPVHPNLKLTETEEIRVEPYARQPKSKREASKTLSILDFTASEANDVRFHIELKSGPASIDDMKMFQLDVNDYDDIIGASCHLGQPTYIVHVQLGIEYRPPTRGIHALGIWWTDFRCLRDNLVKVANRHGESKDAAYFDRRAFKPIETFSDEIASRRYLKLTKLLSPNDLALPEKTVSVRRR